MGIWIGILVAITLVWLTRHIELGRACRRVVTLRPGDGRGSLPGNPKVSVLVAAKDEEANIGTCATTLLRQDYPNYDVTIINDRSTDRTEEILLGIQKNDPNGAKLRVLTVQELPAGWAGKNNAMRMGIEQAKGEWLLLSDADCRQTCDQTISAAMNYALAEKVDLLSILPVLETQTVWERIIQPVAGAVMVFWFNPLRVNNPASRAAYANGAFMLIRREAYEAVGGHAAVRRQLNEDLHMAKLIKQQGLRLRVVQNDGLYLTRMYRNFHETWRGWSRIFYGCFGTVRQLLISAAMLVVMSLLPWISFVIALVGMLASGRPEWDGLWMVSILTILVQLSVLARFYRISHSPVEYIVTWPLGAALCVGMLVSAIGKTLGLTRTAWRGRVYTEGQASATPVGGGKPAAPQEAAGQESRR